MKAAATIAFMTWWAELSPAERRAIKDRAVLRRAYWRARRKAVLFGVLKEKP